VAVVDVWCMTHQPCIAYVGLSASARCDCRWEWTGLGRDAEQAAYRHVNVDLTSIIELIEFSDG
jgi:hypothetical protein